jgi:hypothetical protein
LVVVEFQSLELLQAPEQHSELPQFSPLLLVVEVVEVVLLL